MMKTPRTDLTDRIVAHFSPARTALTTIPPSVTVDGRLGTATDGSKPVYASTPPDHAYSGFLSTADSLFLIDVGEEADSNASHLIQAQQYIQSLLSVISALKATAVEQQAELDKISGKK